MTLPLARQSPSGPIGDFESLSTDDVLNDSIVPGTTLTDALDVLYGRRINYLDVLDGPIGLWNFDATLTAVVGPNLSSAAGSHAFTDAYPGTRGIWLNTGVRLQAAATAALVLTGAMSCECILQMQGDPPLDWICGVGGLDNGASANNVSWAMRLPSGTIPRTFGTLWETGSGTDVAFSSASANGSSSEPFIHQVVSLGFSRSSGGVVQPYLDGRPFGSPSAPLSPPTGGASGIFTVGGRNGQTANQQVLLLSIAVYDRARPPSEWMASYNRSVGNGLGFIE